MTEPSDHGRMKQLVADLDPEEDRIEQLLAQSSLGTPAARRLRERTSGEARARTRKASGTDGSVAEVRPRSYNDARAIGEILRSGRAALVDLSEMDNEDAKRLVDFMAGLTFGLAGRTERLKPKVFLVSGKANRP